LLKKIEKHISEDLPFLQGKKLLVACSGGVDSVVLAHLLKTLKFDIGLAHCNFSLRAKESDGDEDFVIDLADKFSVPIFSETFNTKAFAKKNKLSTQMAARELRYAWFEKLLTDFKYDYVLTGHHADDDLETFFINLSRGTGLKGLLGISVTNERVIRPLLCFGRDAILKYAKEHNLYWREDSSNAKADYLRNKLRLEVLPSYKESSDGLLASFQKTQKHLQDSQGLIQDYLTLVQALAVTEVAEGYQLDIQKLIELPNTDALLYELLTPYDFTDIDAISDLLSAQSGKQVFSNSHRILKDRGVLILTKKPPKNTDAEFFIEKSQKKIDIPISLEIKSIEKIGNITPTAIYVDGAKISYPLQLRKWREGDVFQPFGMKGKKKLSKFFKDEKLSLVAKEKIWLLCSANEIVWIIGHRPDNRFKVDNKTKHILKITLPL